MIEVACDVGNSQLLFSLGRRRQCDDAKDPGAHSFSDGLNRAPLAGGIAPFEQNNDARAFVFHPRLQTAELNLQLAQFRFVVFPLQLLVSKLGSIVKF